MSSSVAKRKRQQREKIKSGTSYNDYLEKQKLLMRENRQMKQRKLDSLPLDLKDTITEERRVKERVRKALYRNRKSLKTVETMEQHSPSTNAYSSKDTFGKAIARVKRNLPGSPRKKRAVIKHLAFEEEKNKPFFSRKRVPGPRALPDSIKTAVIQYYERDEISRQAP